MRTLNAGAIIDKKYAVEKQLGEGGMGVVWLARDLHTDMPVVVKAIRAEYAHRKDFRDRILAEGRALARIDHPNVVRLNAVVSDDDGLCLVMQFIEGETLEDRLERSKAQHTPLPLKEALTIFRQITGAVGAAHTEGIIHRDLKPANVLIRQKDNVVKVTDFGIAKEEQAAIQGKGNTVGVIGSVKYLSPEQCTGHKDIDKRVDIYALGILLYELINGDPPFMGATHYDIMRQHVETTIPPLTPKRPDVPPWVDTLIARCAAKNRDQRFPSCEEILHFLDAQPTSLGSTTEPAAPVHLPQYPQPQISYPQIPQQPIPQTPLTPPAYAQTGTAPAASITNPAEEPSSNRGAMVAITIVLAAALGVAIAFALGLFGPPKDPPTTQNGHEHDKDPGTLPSTTQPPITKEPGSKNPLNTLIGGWKSDSGREYDAVLVGDKLEMRIRDAKLFATQAYETAEPRFILSAIPGQTETFSVEDRLRPTPPTGTEYDPQAARLTCIFPYTELQGHRLEAKLESGKLRVNMAFMKPTTANFTLAGKRVTGCKSLATAPVEPLDSLLSRL